MSPATPQNQIPATFSEDWLEALDGRTRVARVLKDRVTALATDLGGWERLSYQRQSLVKRAIHTEALIEAQEAALAKREAVDLGKLVQATNSLIGLFKTLGLERKAQDVPDLHAYLRQREGG